MKNIVITGDSLSYNRYSYDEVWRTNATDCFVGMDSWSFRLRKALITNTRGFVYADKIKIKEKKVLGIEDDEKHSLFGSRVVTVTPENGKIHLMARSTSGKLAVFLQRRPKNYARFSVSVDGIFKCRVDTYGAPHIHHGYAPLCIEFECDRSKENHEIVFSDFEFIEFEPLVTLAGISEEGCRVEITGQGGRTAKFILYHLDERVLSYSPDTLILIFGGNDMIYYSPEEYRFYLTEIFSKIKSSLPNCKIITVTIPPSAMPTYPVRERTFTNPEDFDEEIERYNTALKELSFECIDTKELFRGTPINVWRHDSVHMSRVGNNMLFNKIISTLK